MILRQEFFDRNSLLVAKDLIGKTLCKRDNGKVQKFLIVETEAYEGLKDLASHASRGETERNKVMFGEPAVWYVYFTYGMHYMLNIVCGKKGHPGAVLIRGITHPQPLSYNKRGEPETKNLLGPAKLTKFLGIDKSFNGKKSIPKNGLWIEDNINEVYTEFHGREKVYKWKLKIIRTPRIGVDSAGSIWSQKKYRFVLDGFETKRFR